MEDITPTSWFRQKCAVTKEHYKLAIIDLHINLTSGSISLISSTEPLRAASRSMTRGCRRALREIGLDETGPSVLSYGLDLQSKT